MHVQKQYFKVAYTRNQKFMRYGAVNGSLRLRLRIEIGIKYSNPSGINSLGITISYTIREAGDISQYIFFKIEIWV